MCGICGAIGLDPKINGEAVVRRMLAAIVHRGPDVEGILVAPPSLPARGASASLIFPAALSPFGMKPARSPFSTTVRFTISASCARNWKTRPHFLMRSDTEVIVHAYEQWGEQFVARLRGMFALAIIEMPQGRGGPASTVFLARDPWALSLSITRRAAEACYLHPKCARCSPAAAFLRSFRPQRFFRISVRLRQRTDDYG